jgi:hypothetical protein
MDQQQSFRSTLVEWLKELAPFGNIDKYLRKTRERFDVDSDADRFANSVTYIFCTEENTYHINAYPDRLSTGASSRKQRPGENWTRGNDLPDGPFCRETWDNFLQAVIRYEMVKLDPIRVAKADETPKLHLEGQATDHIWGMVHEQKGQDVIGLRADCGDGGTLYMTIPQAHEVIDTLNSLLSQLAQQKGKRPKCEIEFKGGSCPCTCLHTTHPVANHAEGCPERPSCGNPLCKVEQTPMETLTRHDTRCPEYGPGWGG